MKNIGSESRFIAFLDESGDHTLEKVDKDFPLFVLAMVVFERKDYVENVILDMGRFKLRYWNHEGINLHSREIRLALGPFSFLQVPAIRPVFMQELALLVDRLPFTLFITCIRKQDHLDRYGVFAKSPYDLALEFTMERVVHFLEGHGETDLPIVAEARGKKEDEDLERVFYRILASGTQFRPEAQFKKLNCSLVFRSKRDNIAGIQIADLCGHPCARYIIDPKKENRACDLVRKRVYNREGVSGWKVFPK